MPTETFTSEGSWTVPDTVQEAKITLRGGEGQAGTEKDSHFTTDSAPGGNGAELVTSVSVSPGDTLYVRFRGGGTGKEAYDGIGGDGGNAADVRKNGTDLSDRIAVAGGGGGGGVAGNQPHVTKGGDGGYPDGSDAPDTTPIDFTYSGGEGATQSSAGGNGSLGQGGDGSTSSNGDLAASGAGAGGYYGGGGGAAAYAGDTYGTATGGGGGSSWTQGTVESSGTATGAPEIIIEYTPEPIAPSGVSFTLHGDDDTTVEWSGDQNADNYRVQRYANGSWTTIATLTGGDRSTSDAPPASTNTLQYRVRTENSAGESAWTYSESISTDPSGLSTTADATSVSLSWSGVDRSTSYEVQVSQDGGGSWSTLANTTGAGYTHSGLENGEQYTYRVRANYSGTDSQFAGPVAQTADLPTPAVDSLSTDSREITVGFSVPDNSADGDLAIERSRDGGSSWTVVTTIQAGNWTGSYTDTDLLDGEEYSYRLTRSTDHTSAQSGTPAATTPLPAPTELMADEIGATSITTSWTAHHNNGETRVEYRRSSDSAWTTDAKLDLSDEQHTITGLLTGEEYDIRAVAATEHNTAEDI